METILTRGIKQFILSQIYLETVTKKTLKATQIFLIPNQIGFDHKPTPVYVFQHKYILDFPRPVFNNSATKILNGKKLDLNYQK